MLQEKKVFFKGLDELRAVAALFVIFHHIELFKSRDSKLSLFDTPFNYFIEHAGKNGVYLFFVLSGFLITYLLLQEKNKYKTISLIKFYMRRIFRIWPLYYLILVISFFVIPYLTSEFDIFRETLFYYNRITDFNNYSLESLLLYLFFIPNLAVYFDYVVVGCSQSWSVGVEEQFYILWPFLILLFNKKILPYVFLLIVILMTFFSRFVLPIFPFEFMSIGALGGFLFFYFPEMVHKLFLKLEYVYFIVILLISIFLGVELGNKYIQNTSISFLFLILILNTVVDFEFKYILKSKVLSFIGRISYGVYMYHPFVMFLFFPIANRYFVTNYIVYNLFIYISIVGFSILLSYLSYKYFEIKFINLKDTKFRTL